MTFDMCRPTAWTCMSYWHQKKTDSHCENEAKKLSCVHCVCVCVRVCGRVHLS